MQLLPPKSTWLSVRYLRRLPTDCGLSVRLSFCLVLPELCFSSTSLPTPLSNYKLLRQQRVPARTLHKFQVHELVHWTSSESTKLKTNFRFFGNFLFSFSPLFFPFPMLLVGVFVFITRLQSPSASPACKCSEDSCNLCGFTSSVLGATRAAALGRGRGRFESRTRRGVVVGRGRGVLKLRFRFACHVEWKL